VPTEKAEMADAHEREAEESTEEAGMNEVQEWWNDEESNSEEETTDTQSKPVVDIIDIHAWKAEEKTDRTQGKKFIKDLLTDSVRKNEGNPGMINRALRIENSGEKPLKCHAVFVWYDLLQAVAKKGEQRYEDETGWSNRPVNLKSIHLAAVKEKGGFSKRYMKGKFQTRRIDGEDQLKTGAISDICREEAQPFVANLKSKDEGKKINRPNMGIGKIKVGWCLMELRNAAEYNDHARDFHGIILNVQEDQEASTSDQDNSTEVQQVEEGATKALEVMVPALKRIGAKKGNYVAMNGMKRKPSKKEVEEGIEELKNVIAADGNWARATNSETTPLEAYGHIVTRIRELIHEDDWPKMERRYYQLSGKRWGRNQVMKISHIETAIREVICQNSGENAIRAFSKFKLSETESLSKQISELGEMVTEFFPEESNIIAYKKDINGEIVPDGPMYTRQIKDIFCIYKILENVPENKITGYSGKIRQLLRPALEDITKFNMEEFIKELKKFETEWIMFENKPKPATPAEEATVATAEVATGTASKNRYIRQLRRLKADTREVKFTKESYKHHKEKVEELVKKHGMKQLCYWCLTKNCLIKRQQKKPDIKTADAESRQRLDNATKNMCENAEEMRKRSESGAVVFTANATIRATVFRAEVREVKQIEKVAKDTLEKRTGEVEDTETDGVSEMEDIGQIGTTEKEFLSSTINTREAQINTVDKTEMKNIELTEWTGADEISMIKTPEPMEVQTNMAPIKILESNRLKTNKIEKEQRRGTNVPGSETKNQNKTWERTIRVTLLGMIMLWATIAPLEITPELMSYMIIGIQIAMGNVTQGERAVARTKSRKKRGETQTMCQEDAEQPELQMCNPRYRRNKDTWLEKQSSRTLDEESNMQ